MKLDQDKIHLIIVLHEKTEFKTKTISKLVKISKRRIQQIIKQYKETGKPPELKKPGRKPKPIPEETRNLILKAHSESKYQGPVHLERWIEENYGIHIPHNTIYRVLKEAGLVTERKRRKKLQRFEADYPNQLWQMDWKVLDWKGERKYLLTILDDASRMVIAYGLFDEMTGENAIRVLAEAIAEFGVPEAVLTDNGAQFVGRRGGRSRFQEFLAGLGVKHVRAAVRHPQTLGKVERFHRTVGEKAGLFDDFGEFVWWYNWSKPHRGLGYDFPGRVYLRGAPVGLKLWWLFRGVSAV
ncbi:MULTISPECIES: DDE-type integrase/transposase/recombinase [unclassified Thermococcus]|uniref:DDE-type integrase/transposase/recombinase n=1 Tax=unclassified Thermococcus TaxID=2627626 RepID=UPI001F0D2E53|nr:MULTISPECIES: DDE-type integrase/transposase/recombinase [unclassified Thermococcus]